MTASIEGKQKRIIDVFSDEYIFKIPRYQRPYSWTKDNVNQMIEDISYFAFQNKDKIDDIPPYFLGSIVLVKNNEKPFSEVIDGQQRLTTIGIILAVARYILNDTALNKFLYEKGDEYSGIEDTYRLILREKDRDFYDTYILKPEGLKAIEGISEISDSKKNIQNNAVSIRNKFTLPEFSQEKLKIFVKYLLQRCYLVVVSTTDIDSAYRIFSVLNDRGMQLSHADILKSEIIGKIEDKKQDTYSTKWESIEESLGIDEFKELFSHIRMISVKAKQRDTILKEIRDHIKPSANPIDFIDKQLEPFAEAYEDIKNCSYESRKKSEEINEILKWLNMIDNTDWIPPAILFFTKYKNSPDVLSNLLSKLEQLASGMMICRADVNHRIEKYAKILGKADTTVNSDAVLEEMSLTDEDKKIIVQVLCSDIYLNKKINKYTLLKIDSQLSSGGASYNHSIITIEHVLPQTPKAESDWIKNFGDESKRNEYVHKLWNLVLLSRKKNSEAQNFDFKTKKEKYFKSKNKTSTFALTSKVLSEDEWTPTVLGRRKTEILDACRDIWNLPETLRTKYPEKNLAI